MVGGAKVRIMLVEGETELSLFQKLKSLNKVSVKSIVKKNLWQESIKNYAITIPKGSELLIVFDCDDLHQSSRFINNVRFLSSRGHKVFLLQQTTNFEEELAWCCGKTVQKLVAGFCVKKTAGVSDFKRDFIACNNNVSKLAKLGMTEAKWFSRDLHEALADIKNMKSSFSKHFTLV